MKRAVIIDDEPQATAALQRLLAFCSNPVEIVGTADNVDSALLLLNQTHPEVIFMDVRLGNRFCFEILEQADLSSCALIITTAYDEYAIQAIRYSAIDYLLKPIDIESLEESLQRVTSRKFISRNEEKAELLVANLQSSNQDLKLFLSDSEGVRVVRVSSIVYCESEDYCTRFFLESGEKILVTKHLKGYERMLEDKGFFRIHNLYLVNLAHVERYSKGDGGQLVLSNKSILPLARRRKDDFLHKWQG